MNLPADFDGAWKDALHDFLPDALALFFPAIHADVDWKQPVEWLDKELQAVIPASERGAQTVDVLLQLTRKQGDMALVVVHIEIQSQSDPTFAERMFRYYSRLFDTYRRPIVSLAILGDESEAWLPSRFESALWGCEAVLRFPTVKLLTLDHDLLATNANPFAAVVLGHRAAQTTRSDSAARLQAKVGLVRGLFTRGYTAEQVRRLFIVLDRLLRLPPDDDAIAWRQIQTFQEEMQMPYISSVERIGIEKGRVEGRVEGEVAGLQNSIGVLLKVRFGEAGSALVPQIQTIRDKTALEELVAAIATAPNLDTVQSLLATPKASN